MPESDESLCRRGDSDVEAGFHWLPGRYGPPPGVERARLARIEAQSDEDFVRDFLRWSPEAQNSLMIGERYRRRTFNAGGWPSRCPANVDELAREGFFWIGQGDRTRCAFCDGSLGNWERGDPPVNQQHRRFFPYCKRARREPCPNVPASSNEETTSATARGDVGVVRGEAVLTACDPTTVAALTNQPRHERYRLGAERLATYRYWRLTDFEAPAPESLCEAGFYYVGPDDQTRCFWCDGSLEKWMSDDDPWREHARWYPGCRFLYLVKGPRFVIEVQRALSDEERREAAGLVYNDAGTDFLREVESGPGRANACETVADQPRDVDPARRVRREDWYVVLNGLGFEDRELEALAAAHDWRVDSFEIASIVDALLARRAGDLEDLALGGASMDEDADGDELDGLLDRLRDLGLDDRATEDNAVTDIIGRLKKLDINAQAAIARRLPDFLDLTRIIGDARRRDDDDDFTDAERDALIVAAGTCVLCQHRPKNTVTLPCGHLVYCSDCAATDTPAKCPACGKLIRGTCRVYFG
jgi:hypothetical protein